MTFLSLCDGVTPRSSLGLTCFCFLTLFPPPKPLTPGIFNCTVWINQPFVRDGVKAIYNLCKMWLTAVDAGPPRDWIKAVFASAIWFASACPRSWVTASTA